MLIEKKKQGYLWVICGVSIYSLSDAIMKYYSPIYGVHQVLFLRTLFRFIPFLMWALISQQNPWRSNKPLANIARSLIATIGTFSYMIAYRNATMTEVFVIASTSAIFVIPFSMLFLREKFCWYNLLAILLGFSGICVTMRPGYSAFQTGLLFALVGAIISALNQVLIKRLAITEKEITIVSYHNLLLICWTLLLGWNTFVPISWHDLCAMSIGGLIAAFAQYSMTHAFKLSTSSGLASAGYFMLIPNVIFDIFLFGKTPDVYTFVGLVLVLSGSITAFHFQSKLR